MAKNMLHVLPLLAFAAAGTVRTSDAHAFEFGTPKTEYPFRSAQNFALELRGAPYYPTVDDEPGLNGKPFERAFGDKARVYVGLELDWQTIRIPYLGTLGPGLGVGRVTMSRDAITVSGRTSKDKYALEIFPLYLVGVLRADALWRATRIPLVPYAKLGLGYGIWNASTTGGTSEGGGVSGKGATLGTHAAAGVMFALDVFDRGATRSMDNATGINGTYLYAELYWANLNGLFQDSVLYVGSKSWAAGMAFEF